MQKFITRLSICIALIAVLIPAAFAATGSYTVEYDRPADKKVMIQIIKSGEDEPRTYLMDSDTVHVPLLDGAGKYTIRICVQSSGTFYKTAKVLQTELSEEDADAAFLASTVEVNYANTNAAKTAAEITKTCKTDLEKITAIHDYLVKNLNYDYVKLSQLNNISYYNPDLDQVLADGKGICYDMASLFAGMCRSVGVKTKMCKGYTTIVDGYHAWNQAYDSAANAWITVDITYDTRLRAGNYYGSVAKDATQYNNITSVT